MEDVKNKFDVVVRCAKCTFVWPMTNAEWKRAKEVYKGEPVACPGMQCDGEMMVIERYQTTDEKTVTLEMDTISLIDKIREGGTDSRHGYVFKPQDSLKYSDANIIHIALEDFYEKMSKAARKSGFNLP